MADTVKVTRVPPVRPPDKFIVELSEEDARALYSIAYGVSGPFSAGKLDNSKGLLHLNLYETPRGFRGDTTEWRERLRAIGNAIYGAIQS